MHPFSQTTGADPRLEQGPDDLVTPCPRVTFLDAQKRVALLRELRSHLALRGFDDGIAEAAADVAVDRVEARLGEISLITSYAKEVAFNEARRRYTRRREIPVPQTADIAALRHRDTQPATTDRVELADLLGRLPHRQAVVAVLLSWGMKTGDIARERDISASTVRRDIAALRTALRPLWDAHSDSASPTTGRLPDPNGMPGGRAGKLARAVNGLGDRQRQVFTLHVHGHSPEATAAMLDIPASSVRSSLTYARKNLRQRLGWDSQTLQTAARDWARAQPAATSEETAA
jgi:DNA-directed RNA polymerase specialized sigma24 family protein